MSSVATSFALPQTIARKVRWLRLLVRSYVLAEGLAATLLTAGCLFWLGLFVDWCFEPSPTARILLWAGAGLALAAVVRKNLVGRLFKPLSDSNLALLVERVYPEFDQSLVTVIEARLPNEPTTSQHKALLERTGRKAGERLVGISLSRVFRFGPLGWKLGAAAVVWVAIGLFALQAPEAFAFYLSRARLNPELWPRHSHLRVEGFGDGEVVNVARDDNFLLRVIASSTDDTLPPEQVQIRYHLADGRQGRDQLTKVGDADRAEGPGQLFTYEFKNLSGDITFTLLGGDARLENLKLHVVERPQLVRSAAECIFPVYLEWAPRSVPFSGRVEIPVGSDCTFQIKANKPLEQVRVYNSQSQQELDADIDSAEPMEFRFQLHDLQGDVSILLEMLDADGVTNKEPYRLVVSAIPDEAPELLLELDGIGTAVTGKARIPLAGMIRDDYGVVRSWAEYSVDAAEPREQELEVQSSSNRKAQPLGTLDLADLHSDGGELKPLVEAGQKLTLAVKAQDAYDLENQPHVGASQRYVLDVVTESELRALLEKRELSLRQRFEALFDKMTAARDLLDRIEVSPAKDGALAATDTESTSSRQRDLSRLGGIVQTATQVSFETEGVITGFEDIVAELVNNRIDTEELTERLEQGIVAPLQKIVTDDLPNLEIRLEQFRAGLEKEAELVELRTAAIVQTDAVLSAMQAVLNRMLELESYNELVDLLRGILAGQNELNEETRQQRREALRRLLDDE